MDWTGGGDIRGVTRRWRIGGGVDLRELAATYGTPLILRIGSFITLALRTTSRRTS
jgi:hypothetical protein